MTASERKQYVKLITDIVEGLSLDNIRELIRDFGKDTEMDATERRLLLETLDRMETKKCM